MKNIRITKSKKSTYYYDTKRKKRISKKEYQRRSKISKTLKLQRELLNDFERILQREEKKATRKRYRTVAFDGKKFKRSLVRSGNDFIFRHNLFITLEEVATGSTQNSIEKIRNAYFKDYLELKTDLKKTRSKAGTSFYGNIKGFVVNPDGTFTDLWLKTQPYLLSQLKKDDTAFVNNSEQLLSEIEKVTARYKGYILKQVIFNTRIGKKGGIRNDNKSSKR